MSQQPPSEEAINTSSSSSSLAASQMSATVAAATDNNGQQTLGFATPQQPLLFLSGAAAAAAAAADSGCNNNNNYRPLTMTPPSSRHPNHTDEVVGDQRKLLTNDPVRREETPFSLKHFLKRNPSTTTANTISSPPSTASLQSPPTSSAYSVTTSSSSTWSTLPTASAQQRSTGARPKVPLNSAAASAYNFHPTSSPPPPTQSSAVPNSSSYESNNSSSARMKRSPKFSSFDSQASLAEFATTSPSSTSLPANANATASATTTTSGHSGRRVAFGRIDHHAADRYPNVTMGGGGGNRYTMRGPATSASAASMIDDDDDDDVSPMSPSSGGGAGVGHFQRSFSTFDIGGGGRRYNLHRDEMFGRMRQRPSNSIIHDVGDDDDDDEDLRNGQAGRVADDDDDADDVARIIDDAGFFDSPTRRALRASAAQAGGLGPLSPDISAALPDFVQDHILVEHLYGSGGGGALPDFTQNAAAADRDDATAAGGSMRSAARVAATTGHMPFDLMCSPSGGCEQQQQQQQRRRQPPNLPLDLPAAGLYHIPLDLTSRNSRPVVSRATSGHYDQFAPAGSAVRTLPDFLADGHVHSGTGTNAAEDAAAAATAAAAVPNATRSDYHRLDGEFAETLRTGTVSRSETAAEMESLLAENTRLRADLQQSQQSLSAQTRRADQLSAAAVQAVYREQLQQSGPADDEDDATTVTVTALQRRVQELTDQVEALRLENACLREEGAVGGATADSHSPTASSSRRHHGSLSDGQRAMVMLESQELSRDMMLAAASAESNLRQLFSGVDNLRLMARRLESLADVCTIEPGAASPASSGVVD